MINDRTLAKLAEAMNKHIPRSRRSLRQLLEMDDPSYLAKDGNEYYIEKSELEFIAKNVDEMFWDRFQIPIILEMTSIGNEYVIFVRDKLHAEFISRTFGIDRFTKNGLMLYSYEMQKVRKKLRTATQVFFRV